MSVNLTNKKTKQILKGSFLKESEADKLLELLKRQKVEYLGQLKNEL